MMIMGRWSPVPRQQAVRQCRVQKNCFVQYEGLEYRYEIWGGGHATTGLASLRMNTCFRILLEPNISACSYLIAASWISMLVVSLTGLDGVQ